jgi:ABC-2 type transport system ATP-binding protein
MDKAYAIVARGLRKSYGKIEVLKGVDLQIEQGTMLALLGPNGAGKTTIVRILSTLLSFDGGTALVGSLDVAKHPNAVREVIGLTGQYAAVDEYLTGRQNLLMMGRLYHLSKTHAAQRAQELLEQFDLVEAANRKVKTYSGGMRRRLDLAISLIATPPILFLDEPTTGLDPRSRLAMWEVIRKLMETGATILLTTQYLEEADQLADRIAVIDHGVVIAEGTASELKKKVGVDRAILNFSTRDDLEAARQIVDARCEVNVDSLTISFAVEEVAHITKILNQLEAARVRVASLDIHKPTLDEVFLELTGKPATEEIATAVTSGK